MEQRPKPEQPASPPTGPPRSKPPRDAGILLVGETGANPDPNASLTETQAPLSLEKTAAFVPKPKPKPEPEVASVQKQDPPPAADTKAGLQKTGEYVDNEPAEAPAAPAKKQTAAPERKQTAAPPNKPTVAKAAAPATGASPSASAVGKLTSLGEFKLVSKLGQGGMGVVYKAKQVGLDRDVALKVLAKHLAENSDFVQRFEREARIMAKLEHPNVLRVYAASEAHGYHYLAMEFVEGGSLEGWLKKLGKLSVGDALHVAIATADALQYAHEQGLIHRDIKPDNILLTKKGVVKVADLGLAKAVTEDVSLTRTGTGAGTPVYMSPEQARDAKHVDGRSDIYALGCMLYCLLTGQPPFKGETYVELLDAKQKGKFPEARRSNPEVPPRLDLFIGKALMVNPDQRYQTCAELIKDLDSLGLANRALSFMQPAGTPVTKAPSSSVKIPTGPTRVAGAPAETTPRAAAPTSAGAAAPGQPAAPADADVWYVNYTSVKGKSVTKKMTTAQVIQFIRDDKLDEKDRAAHSLKENLRPLGVFREFEGVLKHKIAQARADRKTAKFQGVYEKLAVEHDRRKRWRWFWNMVHSTGGLVGFLVWIAVIIGVGVGIYFLVVHYGLPYIVAKFGLKR